MSIAGTNIPSISLGGTQQVFDFSKSNLVLMVGGQILFLIILIMITFFGVEPLTFPAQAVKNMLNKGVNSVSKNSK